MNPFDDPLYNLSDEEMLALATDVSADEKMFVALARSESDEILTALVNNDSTPPRVLKSLGDFWLDASIETYDILWARIESIGWDLIEDEVKFANAYSQADAVAIRNYVDTSGFDFSLGDSDEDEE